MTISLTKPGESAVGWAPAVNENFTQVENAINRLQARVDMGNLGATPVLDLSNGSIFTGTLNQAATFTFTDSEGAGRATTFALILTNGGAFAITWPVSVRWPGETKPTLSAVGSDILRFISPDGGSTWYGYAEGLAFRSYSQLILSHANLKNYFKCDESSGSLADSKGSGSGSAVGSPSYQQGVLRGDPGGNSVKTPNGSNYFSLSGCFDFDSQADITIEYWCQIGTDPSPNNDKAHVSLGTTYSSNQVFRIQSGFQGWDDYLSCSDFNGGIQGTTAVPRNDSTWHHFVAIRSGNNSLKIYKDGTQIYSTTTSGSFVHDGTGWIGNNENLLKVCHVAFYNAALSSSEITSHYNKGMGL